MKWNYTKQKKKKKERVVEMYFCFMCQGWQCQRVRRKAVYTIKLRLVLAVGTLPMNDVQVKINWMNERRI